MPPNCRPSEVSAGSIGGRARVSGGRQPPWRHAERPLPADTSARPKLWGVTARGRAARWELGIGVFRKPALPSSGSAGILRRTSGFGGHGPAQFPLRRAFSAAASRHRRGSSGTLPARGRILRRPRVQRVCQGAALQRTLALGRLRTPENPPIESSPTFHGWQGVSYCRAGAGRGRSDLAGLI